MCEKNKYSLLVIGLLSDHHIQRFVLHLHETNPNARIDFFATTLPSNIPEKVRQCFTNLYVACENNDSPAYMKLYVSIKLLRVISDNDYDVVNIHFPMYYHYFYLKYLRKMTSTILLTPWGSDVYRVGILERFILKFLYKKADKVSSGNNKFAEDVKRIYHIPQDKMVCLDIGSDTIDYINENLNIISKEDAKEKLGVSGEYVITCSYNGSQEHRHMSIIEAINKIKERLPKELVLFFPFTYAGTKEYAERLKALLNEYNLRYIFFEEYLSVEELFLVRRASDMFIHIQPSDANSQCLQEYLLCGSKVLNGEWLRYKELELGGKLPYYLVQDIECLPNTILYAYNCNENLISFEVIEYLKSYGWKEWIKKWDVFFKKCNR